MCFIWINILLWMVRVYKEYEEYLMGFIVEGTLDNPKIVTLNNRNLMIINIIILRIMIMSLVISILSYPIKRRKE